METAAESNDKNSDKNSGIINSKITNDIALGIDIGGTNTAYGLVDKSGKVLYANSISTKKYATAELLIEDIYNDISKKDSSKHLMGIGVGAPNGNCMTGNIEFAPNLQWKGIIPLSRLLEDKFNVPCKLANDANAAAIGEKLFGSAKGLDDFVVITLGTGLGSGIFAEGRLIEGAHGVAGEFGHIRVVPNGRTCGCGRLGCLETYASSTGVRKSAEFLESSYKKNSLIKSSSSAKEIFEFAKKGDEFALEIVDYTAKILGSALADFACFSDPKKYILFGGLAQSGDFFAEKVKKEMEFNILNIYKDKIEISISSLHSDNAAVLGNAANLFWKID